MHDFATVPALLSALVPQQIAVSGVAKGRTEIFCRRRDASLRDGLQGTVTAVQSRSSSREILGSTRNGDGLTETKPPYLSAANLDIETWERDALMVLVGPLSRSELQVDMGWPTMPNVGPDGAHGWCCGKVHCIGGWVGFARFGADPIKIRAYVDGREGAKPLGDLLSPPALDWWAWEATAPQAAQAIVNFLTTGDPKWTNATSGADPV